MRHTHKCSAASALFSLSITLTAGAQSAPLKPEPPLLQSAHVVGDAHDGFRKVCLIAYPNGDYHREEERQVSKNGRAQFEWESPKVFEAKLSQAELDTLRAILEQPEFSSINGVVGDSRSQISKLVFGPQGVIRPHENIEILTIAIARAKALQVFELADFDVARRKESLRTFLQWIYAAERSPAQGFAAFHATNCSSLVAADNPSVGEAQVDTGVSLPKAIYAPNPQSPQSTAKPQPVAAELLINPDGTVSASLQGRPNPDVAQSVLDAVSKWKFEPARLLGVPIAMTIHVKIQLQGK